MSERRSTTSPSRRQDDELRNGGRNEHVEPHFVSMITAFGVTALTFMLLMYALERRGPRLRRGIRRRLALSSVYGFLSGAWPFGVVEAVWCLIALRRFREPGNTRHTGQT